MKTTRKKPVPARDSKAEALSEQLDGYRKVLADLHRSAAGLSKKILDLPDLLQTISNEASRLLNTPAAILTPTDASHASYTVQASSGFSSNEVHLSHALFESVFREFDQSRKKVIQYHSAESGRFLLLPLIQRDHPKALLLFRESADVPEFSEDRLQIAEIFGELASISLENGRMFEMISSSQREWENTFDSISDPIYIIDNDYRLKKMNKSLASYAMRSIKLPPDRNCYRYLFHRNNICPWCPVPTSLQTGQAVTVESPIFTEGIWQIQSFILTDKSEKRTGSINVLRDITPLKRMQDQLIESEKMASTGKLISGVAHEVRNPLFGISTTARALANELGNTEGLKPFLDIITNETTRLNRLMEELLNYSRPVKIDKNPSDMGEIVRSVISQYQNMPDDRNITINLYTSENIPSINIDRNKIHQVLANLFENAIQHSGTAPRLDVFLEYLSLSYPPEIQLVVKDNGSGISPSALPRIFDPFFTTRQKGTGLGLSIVRKVIHDHGGRISVESHSGVGTTFRISLPAPPAS